MRRYKNRYLYTPSDLLEFLSSPFATWMTRGWLDDPSAAQPDAHAPQQLSLEEHGRRHEQAFLNQLRAQGRQVYSLPPGGDRARLTRSAMQAGHEVIFHGVLAQADFVGEADFLVRVEAPSILGSYSYEVWETKLARVVRPEFLVQLCGYADLLESVQGRCPQQLHCVSGNGHTHTFRTADYVYYYRALKRAFVAFLEECDPGRPPPPNPWGDNGRWQSHAEALLESSDHLCRVANISQAQVEKLQAAGIRTMGGLADTDRQHVARMDDTVFARLREQARLQIASAGADTPAYQIVTPTPDGPRQGLALLPPESADDVYFDIEGYPLVEGGLEYLFGVSCVELGRPRFLDWWAHDADQEKRAFEDFVDWVFARWQADPGLHIYHYGQYEVATLRRLMGRYGTRETEVDHLLRNGVFIDLYTIVRQGLRVGEPRYSIKNLERLYRAKRTGTVTSALDSVVWYERWLASQEPPDWRASSLLRQIRDYNRDDCESSWQLTRWLRERQREAGIVPPEAGQPGATESAEPPAQPNPRHELAERLLADIPRRHEERAQDEQRWQIHEMLGQVVEFHRREEKPLWWAAFDRHAMTEQELIEDLDCLGGLRRESDRPLSIKRSVGYWYRFDPDQDTKLSQGTTCFFAHNLDITADIHELDRDAGRVCLKFGAKTLRQLQGQEPPAGLSLIPNEIVSPEVIARAIEHTARSWQEGRQLSPALADFLARRQPRLHPAPEYDGTHQVLVAPDEDLRAAAVRLVSELDRSSLCIQGPPGTGKTTVGAAVIVSLLRQGKRVGISSNSHAAILNLMQKCSELQNGQLDCIKVGGPQDAPFFSHCRGARYVKSIRDALPELDQVGLIGGTAWAFSAAGMRDKLDYLFVDEAGQVSVANLIGMAASAKNLVLLGDQMQLGQPIQGSHPGHSGQSALEYLLQGQATIPDTLGLFLDTSWRLHPSLCRFISDTMYDGRLRAAVHTKNRLVRMPAHGARSIHQEAGLVFVPVVHTGNTQASAEEVALIREIVHELLGRELTDETGRPTGVVGLDDILLVAPYNMQVRKLQAALGPQARVGSVDKFQGQEAAVVIVSMCASHGEASPRGIEFLFNRNRLNVALSRARSLAIVVAHPGLSRTRCTTLNQMTAVNVFCRVVEEGGSAEAFKSLSRERLKPEYENVS